MADILSGIARYLWDRATGLIGLDQSTLLVIGALCAVALGIGWAVGRIRWRQRDLSSISRFAQLQASSFNDLSDHDHGDEDDEERRTTRKSQDREERSRRALSIIEKIEKARGSRVIAIIHRETLESYSLGMNDLEDVLTALNATPADKPIDVVLHTLGGYSLAAMQISRALKAHKGKKTAYVPYFAMSAGTMIALACDEIIMTPSACLGPIDPQFGLPAVSILKASRSKPVEHVSDSTLIFADMSEKAILESKAHACELMQGTYSHDGSCSITDELSSGKWTHGNPITVGVAQGMGLFVKTGMPQDFIDLVRCHRVPRKGGASVAFR